MVLGSHRDAAGSRRKALTAAVSHLATGRVLTVCHGSVSEMSKVLESPVQGPHSCSQNALHCWLNITTIANGTSTETSNRAPIISWTATEESLIPPTECDTNRDSGGTSKALMMYRNGAAAY